MDRDNNQSLRKEWEPSTPETATGTASKALSFLDIIALVWRWKWVIAIVTVVFAVGSLVIAFVSPPVYETSTTLMPINLENSSNNSQYAGLAAMAGISLPGNSLTPAQKIVTILQSRTLCEQVVKDLNLVSALVPSPSSTGGRDPFNLAVDRLRKNILTVTLDDISGLITVTVDFGKQKTAQDIANHAIKVLESILNQKSLTMGQKTTQVLEDQIVEQEKKVEVLQTQMARFQKNTKIIDPQGQVTNAMALYSNLLGQKIQLEVQLARLANALSADNPQVTATAAQLEGLNKQIKNIESQTGVGSFSIDSTPEQIVEYENIARDLDIATKIYSGLLASYENQILQNAQDQIYVEVIDTAIYPEVRSKPSRKMIVIVGTLAGFLIGIAGLFVVRSALSLRKQLKTRLGSA
jgi:uncharacterized protein involved in exopolysaccharide biosynthesis